jgi:hypothetical protein
MVDNFYDISNLRSRSERINRIFTTEISLYKATMHCDGIILKYSILLILMRLLNFHKFHRGYGYMSAGMVIIVMLHQKVLE